MVLSDCRLRPASLCQAAIVTKLFDYASDMSGIEPHLQGVIVFIRSQSSRSEDILAAHDRQGAGYLVKSQVQQDHALLPQLLVSYCRLVALQTGKH